MADSMVADVKYPEHWTPLERDTAAYFDPLPQDAQDEELRLGVALDSAADEIEFDG